MVGKRERRGKDDGRPAVSADKYVASVFAAKETGNNKRAVSEGGERGEGGREKKGETRKGEEERTLDERGAFLAF